MKKSGNQKNGEKQNSNSSLQTLFAANAEIRLKFPITRISKSTGNQNISIYLTQDPTVTFAITESIKDISNARFAANFDQNQKVKDAIGVLRRAMLSALRKAENEEPNPRTNKTGKTTASITRKRKSISKPGDGK